MKRIKKLWVKAIEYILKGRGMKGSKRRKILVNITLAASILMCVGCASDNEPDPDSVIKIYEVKSDGSGLMSFDYELKGISATEQIDEVINALGCQSDKLMYKTAIGETYDLVSYDISNDQLSLNFSEKYRIQDKVGEILNRAAIVRTFGQLDCVNGVSFFIEGEALTDTSGNPVGIMTPEQYIFNAGKEINAYEQTDIVLFFADAEGTGLKSVTRNVVYSSNISLDKLVMDELVKGPLVNEDGMMTIPPETKVMSTTVTDGICYVSLDASFLGSVEPVVSPEAVIYSIVNSLVALPNVNKVSISIDGDNSIVYRELIPLSTVFERNLEIID